MAEVDTLWTLLAQSADPAEVEILLAFPRFHVYLINVFSSLRLKAGILRRVPGSSRF